MVNDKIQALLVWCFPYRQSIVSALLDKVEVAASRIITKVVDCASLLVCGGCVPILLGLFKELGCDNQIAPVLAI